jgi:zinc protease
VSDLHVTEVDGVPTVWADVPGPLTAGLLIRVGHADETLPTRGHSHMLEHLALFGLDRPGEHSNGQVDATSLLLHTSGGPEEVSAFLARAARQLVEPPTARLQAEKGVLKAEASQRRPHALTELLVWRWGMQDYGLEAADELGLDAITPESVLEWSRRFVARQNAALWFTGPPPAGLSLDLPDGEHRAPPAPRRTALPELPAFFRTGSGHAAFHAMVDRTWESSALASALRARLVDDLRVNRAAAYSPEVGYRPLDAGSAALMAMSDHVDGRAAEVTERLLATLAELADTATMPTEAEIAAHRTASRRAMEGMAALPARVSSSAWDLLHGKPVRGIDELYAGLDGLEPEGVRRAARSAGETAVAQVPGGVDAPSGWQPAPMSTAYPVFGTAFEFRGDQARLVVGAAGVTFREGPSAITVRYDDLAAACTWDDGGRILIGNDGVRLVVEPTLWRRGSAAVREIDGAVPEQAVVSLGARPPDSVPRPAPLSKRLARHRGWILAFAATVVLIGTLYATGAVHGSAPLIGAAIGVLVFTYRASPRNGASP